MLALRRGAALLAVLLTSGCPSATPPRAVSETPRPATATPLAEVRGSVDLAAAAGADVRIYDVAALPSGTSVVLLGSADDPATSYLAEIGPGKRGPEPGRVRRIPGVTQHAQLFAAPDGTLLVAGTTVGPGGYQLIALAPGTATPTVRPLDPAPAEPPDGFTAALSPDGRMLYAALSWAAARFPARLVAIDVATGAVRGTAPLDAGPTAVAHLAARPDGGLDVLVSAGSGAAEAPTRAVLLAYDSTLRPVGVPVQLAPDVPESSPLALQVTAGGTAVATLTVGYSAAGQARLVVVSDGRVRTSHPLPDADRPPIEFAVDPGGHYAYLPLTLFPYATSLTTIDLDSGGSVASVPLCPAAGVFGHVALTGDGRTLTVTGVCLQEDGRRPTAFLVS